MTVTSDRSPEPREQRTSLLQEGDERGRWKLEAQLKAGWPTQVWRAIRDDKRIGVLKFLVDESKKGRFQREFELTSHIDNRWTPRAIEADFGLFPFWIAFDYVEADTLAQVIDDGGPLQDEDLDEFGRQLWEARTYFDREDMAHRDLSARNVLLRRGDSRVVVIDWGTGRHDVDDETATMGSLPCSAGFAAPEQVLDDGDIGRLADVWGWGSVVYYAATGRTVLPAIGYAESLRNRAPIDWSDAPERWIPALQAALVPTAIRDADSVTAQLPLHPREKALKDATTKARQADAEMAALRAEIAGKDAQLVALDRRRLAELQAREEEAAEETARLRQALREATRLRTAESVPRDDVHVEASLRRPRTVGRSAKAPQISPDPSRREGSPKAIVTRYIRDCDRQRWRESKSAVWRWGMTVGISTVFLIVVALATTFVVIRAQKTNSATLPPELVKPQPVFVLASAGNGVDFVAPASGNYRFTIHSGSRYCTAPDLCRSVVRGYKNKDIAWGVPPVPEPTGWVPEPTGWDYTIGCFQDETVANPDCGAGLSSPAISLGARQFVRWVIVEDKNSFGDNSGKVELDVERLT